MDSFSSSLGSEEQQMIENFKTEMAVANAQELLSRVTNRCYAKCISKPGSRLDSSDTGCLDKCMERYMDVWNTVARTYAARIQRESAGQR